MSDDVPCRVSIDLANHELKEEKLEARYREWVSSGECGAAIEKELEELMTDPELVSEGMGVDGSPGFWQPKYKNMGQLAYDEDYEELGRIIAEQLRAYVMDRAIENAENNWRSDDE